MAINCCKQNFGMQHVISFLSGQVILDSSVSIDGMLSVMVRSTVFVLKLVEKNSRT